MNKRSKIIVATGILLATAFGVVAIAGSNGGYCSKDGGDFAEHISKRVSNKLELTEAQQSNLDGLLETLMEKRNSMKNGKQAHRQELLALLDADTLDQNKISSMLNQKAESVQAAAPEVITALAQFTDSLTAEQRTELKEHLENRMQGRHWR